MGYAWKKICARKLRKAANKMDPLVKAVIPKATAAELDALNGLSGIGQISNVFGCGDGLSRMYTGYGGSFAVENVLDKSLREKGFISTMGRITFAGHQTMEMGA